MESRVFTIIGWVLAILMALYVSLVIVPSANADTPNRARLMLEIEDENLRIFEFETKRMLCYISIMDVRMIGAQHTLTCVRKDSEEYRPALPLEFRITPPSAPE